jgi:DNA topoisomerase I
MELKLDEVKDGEVTRLDLLNDFYTHFKSQYELAGDLPPEDPSLHFYGSCPTCKVGTIVPRRSRFGVFLGCNKYPSCKFVSSDVPLPWIKEDPSEREDDEDGNGKGVFQSKKPVSEPIGKDCPLCGKPLIKRFAKRGGRPFVGCSGFPSCRHLENLDGTVIVLKERPNKKSAKSAKPSKSPKAKKTKKA